MKLKILGIIIAVFIAIQFVPYGKEHSNPAVVAEPSWDSPQTRETFFVICSDCHSNETKWPFYSNVAPVSWLVQADVDEGRGRFNVSEWNAQGGSEGDAPSRKYKDGEMPPWIYRLPRPQTRLSDADKARFIKGLKATFNDAQ